MATISFTSSDFRINETVTAGDQSGARLAPIDGGFLAVWASGGAESDIVARRYDAAATTVGFEFTVNELTDRAQTQPTIFVRDDGTLLLGWDSDLFLSERYAARVLESDAQFGSDEFSFAGPSGGISDYRIPEPSIVEGGGRIVALYGSGTINPNNDNVSGAIFSDTLEFEQDFRFHAELNDITKKQANSHVALADDFAVFTYATGGDIFGRTYDLLTLEFSERFPINAFTTGDQSASRLAALDDGGFLAVWQSEGQDGDGSAIVGRRFDADGDPVGFEFQVNATTAGDQGAPSLLDLGDGGFLVAYRSGAEGEGDILGRIIDADGAALSDETPLVGATDGEQGAPALVALPSLGQGFVGLTWEGEAGARADGIDVYGRVLRASGRDLGEGLDAGEARYVAYLYEAALNRDGDIDLPGLNFWIDQREAGMGRQEIAQFFLDSPEFAAAFGDPDMLDDRALVETLYRNVLDREGEPAGVDFWTGVVGQETYSRAQLLSDFAVSPENLGASTFVETLGESFPGFWEFV